MTFDAALSAYLQADSGIAALAGNRVYPDYPPQPDTNTALPLTVYYQLASLSTDAQLDGAMAVYEADYRVCVCGSTHKDVVALQDAVIAALNGKRGVIGGVGGREVLDCRMTGGFSLIDESIMEQRIYAREIDFSLKYR